MAVEERRVAAGGSTNHIGKKLAVENGVDGTLVATAVWVDEHVKAVTEDRAKFGHNDPMEVNETKQLSWSAAERISAADIMHRRLLKQMQCFCTTVQNMGDRMEGKFAEDGLGRQEENQKLNTEMCARMDEGRTQKMRKVPESWCTMI